MIIEMKKALFNQVAGSLLLTAGLLASGAASAQTTLTFNADGNADFTAAHAWSADTNIDTYLFDLPQNPAGSPGYLAEHGQPHLREVHGGVVRSAVRATRPSPSTTPASCCPSRPACISAPSTKARSA